MYKIANTRRKNETLYSSLQEKGAQAFLRKGLGQDFLDLGDIFPHNPVKILSNSVPMIQIIWAHGWGFDATCFKSLAQALPQYQHHFLDQGYFGKAIFPIIPENSMAIGIGHSLGFAKLLQSPIPLQGIISLCGFYRFAATSSWPYGIPVRSLKRMITKFKQTPTTVLKDFYDRCGLSWAPPTTYRNDLLLQDLQNLETLWYDKLPFSILGAIASSHDLITPLPLQQSLFQNLLVIPEGGHLPWVKNFNLCSDYLTALIQTITIHDKKSHSSSL
jgi:pimeloyl-[acyl-carrier protein] methyl ester esterase